MRLREQAGLRSRMRGPPSPTAQPAPPSPALSAESDDSKMIKAADALLALSEGPGPNLGSAYASRPCGKFTNVVWTAQRQRPVQGYHLDACQWTSSRTFSDNSRALADVQPIQVARADPAAAPQCNAAGPAWHKIIHARGAHASACALSTISIPRLPRTATSHAAAELWGRQARLGLLRPAIEAGHRMHSSPNRREPPRKLSSCLRSHSPFPRRASLLNWQSAAPGASLPPSAQPWM